MSNIIKSHFYIVKGTLKGGNFPSQGWRFHSLKPLEEFCQCVVDIIPEYDLEVEEVYIPDMVILDTWKIPAGHWS